MTNLENIPLSLQKRAAERSADLAVEPEQPGRVLAQHHVDVGVADRLLLSAAIAASMPSGWVMLELWPRSEEMMMPFAPNAFAASATCLALICVQCVRNGSGAFGPARNVGVRRRSASRHVASPADATPTV